MPEQYTINGIINFADRAEHIGTRVQAFDRDLPSLEQRAGFGPKLLGEVITDAEGRFQIAYTLDQFSRGEASSLIRRVSKENADITFLVFDQTGQPLNIKRIEVGNRSYQPAEIIFNAPANLEGVYIFVEALPAADTSEYEKLLALITPVIEDVPLAELTNEDIVFLSNELGLEQQRVLQQRIEWLHWSALLEQETGLNIQAFYGWARTGLPDLWREIQMPDGVDQQKKITTQLLDKLAAATDQELVAHLTRAIDSAIISSRFLDRVNALSHAIRRRALTETTVKLRLERAPNGEALAGYVITTFDADANNRDLGTDVVDALGEFEVILYIDGTPDFVERNLRFRVRGPSIGEAVEHTEHIKAKVGETVSIRISLAAAPPTLQQLQGDGHIDLSVDVLQILSERHDIHTFADIRRRGGLSRVTDLRGIDSTLTQRLDALADLDRLSNDIRETSSLLEQRFTSVFAISESSRNDFVAVMSRNVAGLSAARATELHVAAQAQTDFLAQVFAGIASDVSNGFSLPINALSSLEARLSASREQNNE